eukprot:520864-Prymnesium_polylepis.1
MCAEPRAARGRRSRAFASARACDGVRGGWRMRAPGPGCRRRCGRQRRPCFWMRAVRRRIGNRVCAALAFG